MFKRKKQILEVENKLQDIKRETEELLKIKAMLDDKSQKVDINNLYVWENKGIYYIVKMEVNSITGRCLSRKGPRRNGLESILIDIFTNKVIYQKCSISPIKSHELITIEDDIAFGEKNYYARFYPICEIEKDLLIYVDKKVPLYVLQQLYYKLNDIDITKNKIKSRSK